MSELTISRLQYILYLYRSNPKDCSVTKIANVFSVSKSTASRNLDGLLEQGIVFEDKTRLTDFGRSLAEKSAKEVELFQKWISQTVGGEDEDNLQNAMQMVVNLSEEMKERLVRKIQLNELFEHLDSRGSFTFDKFSGYLPEGRFPLPFVIYKSAQDEKHYSMADRGFVHPAILRMSGGAGMIQLKAVTMERRNLLDGLLFSGKLMDLDYLDKKKYVPAVKDGDFYQIPADALEYTFHKEENLLIGSIQLQMRAPLSKGKMHTRQALLSVLLQKL